MKRLFDEKVYESDLFEVHQDWEVPIPAFFILAPKRKLRSISEFTEEEQEEFGKVLCLVRKGMHEALGIRDAYLFQNEDTSHGFHVWIFPRHDWMERFGRRIESVRPIMEYAKAELASDDKLEAVRKAAQKMRGYLGGA